MRGRGGATLALAFAVLALPACYQADAPLGPPGERADPELLGRWRCVSTDEGEETLSLMTVEAGKSGEYAVTFGGAGEEADHYRGHGTVVQRATFVSVRELQAGVPAGKWVYVRYRVLQPGVIDLRIVDDRLLKTEKTPANQRAAIERHLDDPRLYGSLIVCARRVPKSGGGS